VYGAARTIAAPPTPGVHSLRMDVTDEQSVALGCAAILEREGRLDVLVNSAGTGIAGAIELTTTQEARAQFEVNFFGVLRVCRAVLPAMRKQGSGTIINIGSIAGQLAVPYQGLYSASKFALEGLTEALRLEVRGFGIRVVLIEPGDHRTSFTRNRVLTAESSRATAYREPCRRAIERMERDEQRGPGPEQIARLVNRIIRSSSPRLRYSIGPASQRAAVWLKRLGPHRLIERIMAAYYRV
jgi:NAD(P)-dependent dehydrogenase (short-subunit alcohol dehydrogenase family)